MNTRREFLCGLSASAFGVVTGCCGRRMLSLPCKDETLVAFLSDCHVGNWKSSDCQRVKFADCLARVLALDPLPGKMIIAGDLAYLWGRREDYELSKKLLQPVCDAGIEVTIAMGNHDRRENFLEFWPSFRTIRPAISATRTRSARRHRRGRSDG